MTVQERLRQLAAALPSDDSAVTLTRADLVALLEGEAGALDVATRDMTVKEVAEEMQRAPSTVRGWLIAGHLNGYKLNRRDWRVTRSALRAFIEGQSEESSDPPASPDDVDITAWRKVRGAGGGQ
jgi:excisionase family DNA binding protein